MTGTVGLIGLGIMGSAYATHLIGAGYDVHGADPLPEARERLARLGETPHEQAGEWLAGCDIALFALLSPEVMKQVAATIAALARPPRIVLETGTFAMADKRAAHDILRAAGVDLLDCPVSGTGAQAAAGDLLMMASGRDGAIDAAMPVLRTITKRVIRAGEFGAGTRLKFVANHAVALHNVAAAETLTYADALGLDRALVYDMLSNGAGQSRMSDLRMPLMIEGRYDPPTASLKMFEKDLSLIGADIAENAVPAPLFDACTRLYEDASRTLPESFDTAAVFEVYRSRREG